MTRAKSSHITGLGRSDLHDLALVSRKKKCLQWTNPGPIGRNGVLCDPNLAHVMFNTSQLSISGGAEHLSTMNSNATHTTNQ